VGHRGAEILGKLDLAARVASPGGDGHAAQTLRAKMDAKAAREQPVAGHVLKNVVPAHANHVDAARHEVGPGIDVVLRVADGHGRAGGAAGAVHAHDLGLRHAQKSRGVLRAQILLCGKGDAPQIIETADGIRPNARFVQALTVKIALARLGHCASQPRKLGLLNLIPAPTLRLIKEFHAASSASCRNAPRRASL